MNYITITSGKFSDAGNFTASSILGKKIFVSKNLLESAGITPATIKYPLFGVWTEEMIGQRDPITRDLVKNPDGTFAQVSREGATALFLTKDAMQQACLDDDSLERDIKNALVEASTKGLSQKSVDALANLV